MHTSILAILALGAVLAPAKFLMLGALTGTWALIWTFLSGNAGIILSVLGGLLAGWKWLDLKRKATIATAVYYAFHALQDWEDIDPAAWKADAGDALKLVDTYMVGQGWRPLKPGEQGAAQVAFQGMAGAVAKVATLGTTTTAPAPVQAPPAPSPK